MTGGKNGDRAKTVDDAPYAFLSSVFEDPKGEPLKIREQIWRLGLECGRPVWAADFPPEHRRALSLLDPLERIDECLKKIGQSQVFICLLHRRHGSGIPIPGTIDTWHASYFELEIFYAVLLEKPIHIFQIDGSTPSPSLSALLRLLGRALDLPQKTMSERSILKRVRDILEKGQQSSRRESRLVSEHRESLGRLVVEFAKGRSSGVVSLSRPEIEFLDGRFENRDNPPERSRVEKAFSLAMAVDNKSRRLTRLWIAIRELMAAPYGDNASAGVLDLWNSTLSEWASAAAWYGLHGHLRLGCLAALGTVSRVRARMRRQRARFNDEPTIPPHAAVASEFYSLSKYLPEGTYRRRVLRVASAYIGTALRSSGGDRAGQLAIRASIRLLSLDQRGALRDYERVVKMRAFENAGGSFVGDALTEFGFALLQAREFDRALEYLEAGVDLLPKTGRPGLLTRALRKLAIGYLEVGHLQQALDQLASAYAVASGADLFDQMVHIRRVALQIRSAGLDVPPELLGSQL